MIDGPIPSRLARRVTAGLGILVSFFVFLACGREASVPNARATTPDSSQAVAPSDTGLRYPFVPDPARTPGAALEVTAADICVPGYSKRVRDVPTDVKRQVYASYGVRTHQPGEYEIDHLINLSLGGSNSVRNLWPQSFRTSPWNARVKDELEVELHRRVCAGTLDLAKAQRIIAQNWVMGYRIYVNPNPPTATTRTRDRARRRRVRHSQPRTEAPVP
jgi:hypothetical protein